MSHLRNKSEINSTAAKHLQQFTYYPSVVHCAYYSCVQLMRHILFNKMEIAESDLEAERKSQTTPLGNHEYIINRLNKELKNSGKDWETFNNNILQLKKLRTIADYKDSMIDCKKGESSISLSEIVIKHLRKNFTV